VTGGHPIFLLQHARASGFLDLVRTRVLNGEFYYGGISAGAAPATRDLPPIAAPTIPASSTTRPARPRHLLPAHAREPRPQQRHAQLIAANPEREFVTLTDDQALIVFIGLFAVRDAEPPGPDAGRLWWRTTLERGGLWRQDDRTHQIGRPARHLTGVSLHMIPARLVA
jgi:hypothetical protein